MDTRSNQEELTELHTGDRGIIWTLEPGKTINSRLSTLGFTPGAEIIMTHNYGRGPLVVTVRGARVALGRQEARRIHIQRYRE